MSTVGPGGGLVGPGGALVGPFSGGGLSDDIPTTVITVQSGVPSYNPNIPVTVITVDSGEPTQAIAGAAIPVTVITVDAGVPTTASVEIASVRPFGSVGLITSVRPFAIEELEFTVESIRPFEIRESPLEVYTPPAGISTTLAANAPSGSTSIVVTDATGIAPGKVLLIDGTELVRVANSYVSGTTIPLVAATTTGHLLGDPVADGQDLAQVALVFDKAGVMLGWVEVNVVAAPSRSINGSGDTIIDTYTAADGADLLVEDHLILLGDPDGNPWAGTITRVEWQDAAVTCFASDLFGVFDEAVELVLEVADSTSAGAAYGAFLDVWNAKAIENGELLWDRDFAGSKTFMGDIDYSGSMLDACTFVAGRSGTEFAWSVSVAGDQLVPALVVRDKLSVAGGGAISDGPTGTVVAKPRVRQIPDRLVHSVVIRGETTNLDELVPEWARWALHEVTPEATAAVSPSGDERLRNAEVIRVDWSLSKAEQRRLAAETVAIVRQMYYSFLRAVHDQWGRPWHEGWLYLGPPDELEPELTKDKYITDLQLVEYQGQPASNVMTSGSKSKTNLNKRAIVTYDRATSKQEVRIIGANEIGAGQTVTASIPSGKSAVIYDGYYMRMVEQFTVNGPVSFGVEGANFTAWKFIPATLLYGGGYWGRGLFESRYDNVRVRYSPYIRSDNIVGYLDQGDRFEGNQSTYGSLVNGSRIWRGYKTGHQWVHDSMLRLLGHIEPWKLTLRRITDGPYAGKYVRVEEVTITTTPLGDGNRVALINKVYPFEEPLIALWDPRRDGIGVFGYKDSVIYAAQTSQARWNFVPWNAGAASTSLAAGLTASATSVLVKSGFGFPEPPFIARLGYETGGPGSEDVQVTAAAGADWTVTRAVNGTTAIIHEEGEPVTLMEAEPWEGFEIGWGWPEGDAWADAILEQLSTRRWVAELEVSPVPANTQLGSLHTVTITTEGPTGFASFTGRVKAMSRDVNNDICSLYLEEDL